MRPRITKGHLARSTLTTTLSAYLAACGSGNTGTGNSGNDSVGGNTSDFGYNGIRSEAQINAANADTLSIGIYTGGDLSGPIGDDTLRSLPTLASHGSRTLKVVQFNYDMLMVDDSTHLAIWLSNFVQTNTLGDTTLDITFDGRYYDSEHGFVTVTRPAPLRINEF